MDGTLIQGNGSFHFGRFLYRRGYLSRRSMMRLVGAYASHRYFGRSLSSVHDTAFQIFFRGRQRTQLDHLVAEFLDGNLHNLWYRPAVDQLQTAKSAGHQIVILSSSPDFLVEAIARRLGIDVWQASTYPVDNTGHLTASPLILAGQAKGERLTELADKYCIPSANTIAYSDSILDLPFLLAAGRQIAVRPDRALRKLCTEHAWQVI